MQTCKTHSEIFNEFVNQPNVQKALNKQQFSFQNGTLVFRIRKSIKYMGLILTISSIGMLFIQATAISIILFLLLGALGIPLLLIGLHATLYLDEEKILYRNPIGIRKIIYWKDVKSVYFTSLGNEMKICSDDVTILPNTYYKGAEFIDEVIRHLVPKAFDINTLLEVRKSKDFIVEEGVILFKIRKLIGIFAIIFLAVFWGATPVAYILDKSPMLLSFILIALLWNIPLILALLYTFLTRLYIGKESITYKNCFGVKRSFRWEEIEKIYQKGREGLKVYGRNKRMKISANFAGYDLINRIVSERCPNKIHNEW